MRRAHKEKDRAATAAPKGARTHVVQHHEHVQRLHRVQQRLASRVQQRQARQGGEGTERERPECGCTNRRARRPPPHPRTASRSSSSGPSRRGSSASAALISAAHASAAAAAPASASAARGGVRLGWEVVARRGRGGGDWRASQGVFEGGGGGGWAYGRRALRARHCRVLVRRIPCPLLRLDGRLQRLRGQGASAWATFAGRSMRPVFNCPRWQRRAGDSLDDRQAGGQAPARRARAQAPKRGTEPFLAEVVVSHHKPLFQRRGWRARDGRQCRLSAAGCAARRVGSAPHTAARRGRGRVAVSRRSVCQTSWLWVA